MNERKKAILVVSFGTCYEETRKKTLDRIEKEIQDAFPAIPVYRAWTSSIICRKLLLEEGMFIPGVLQALEQMSVDGVEDIFVQPTHMMHGFEHEKLYGTIMENKSRFHKVSIGNPLLTFLEDCDRVICQVAETIGPGKDEALLLMGHGTMHYANFVYAALDYRLKELGYENIHMGTVEAWPSFDSVFERVKQQKPKKVILSPFMMVAGDHALNDLSGKEEDSWKSRLEAAGYQVECVLKGLGEYPVVREIILEHLKAAMEEV